MNWLDVVLLIILVVSTVTAFSKGLTREIVGTASTLVALLAGIWFYGTAASYVQPYMSSKAIANFCGFVIVFALVSLLGAVVGFVMGRMLKVTGLSPLDHMLGALFGVVRGILLSIALVMAMMAFSAGDKPPAGVLHSRIAPYVVDAARVIVGIAPHELKTGFRKTYAQVKTAWEDALKKGIRDLPRTEKKNEREI